VFRKAPAKTLDGRWVALDQIRAVAAYLVFCWHFIHWSNGYPVPFEYTPSFPGAAIIDEGHTGVALFMCLSGYLFAKLLDGREINYPAFLLARIIRLGPLLVFAFILNTAYFLYTGDRIHERLWALVTGFVLPTWPNGGWSIAVELHFYLLLPFLLAARKRAPWAVFAILAAAILLRTGVWYAEGTVMNLAYSTIFGRIDQFLLGIVVFASRDKIRSYPWLGFAMVAVLAAGYWVFDMAGGLEGLGGYTSPSPIWIVMPTFEAVTYSLIIATYDGAGFASGRTAPGRLMARLGHYSYGIYLMHFFTVQIMVKLIERFIMPLGNFYVAWAWATVAFVAMLPVAWLANLCIERPFEKLKPRYSR
jgi:peptidoglycan/LPS O-acetylase OafA/YrhL